MNDIFWWSGVIVWAAFGLLGMYWTIDAIAEWVIDSSRFKAYVWRYLKDRQSR